jgi:hypothetical protein
VEFSTLRERYDGFYVPGYEVRVGAATYAPGDGVVAEVTVETAVDAVDRCVVVLAVPFDRAAGRFPELDWDDVAVGETLSVSLGYGDRLVPLFLGTVETVRPAFPADGPPTVEVSGFDPSYAMTRGTRSRSWDERTDADVVADVASAYEFATVETEATGVTRRKVFQEAESDYRLCERLAARNGFELFARRDALYFRTRPYDAEPVVDLRYGESVTSFAPEFGDVAAVGEVVVRHWDPAAKREVVGTAENPEGGAERRVLRLPVASREEAEREAAAALERALAGTVGGTGETVGLPELVAGETVSLDGLDVFTNVYYIVRSTHHVNDSGYTTSFEVTERGS